MDLIVILILIIKIIKRRVHPIMNRSGAACEPRDAVISPDMLRSWGREIFDGVTLYAVNLPRGRAVNGDFRAPRNSLEFGYVLSGKGRIQGLGRRRDQRFEMTGNRMALRHPPGARGHFQTSPEEDLALLGLEFTPEAAERLLPRVLPQPTERALTSAAMSAHERSLAWQLLDVDACADFGPLYRQGLVLQLLAVSARRLGDGGAGGAGSRPLGRPERQKVLAARDLLDARLESPVDIEDMAREVGLSPARLKAGFQIVTGHTPFRYLHEQKMHHARQLLLLEGCSVSEAAWRIGYTNVSHFGAAFRRLFGLLPGELLGRSSTGDRTGAWA
ncbi:helix-turn-helix transcriptional regulator [Desulfovibrio sp.]